MLKPLLAFIGSDEFFNTVSNYFTTDFRVCKVEPKTLRVSSEYSAIIFGLPIDDLLPLIQRCEAFHLPVFFLTQNALVQQVWDMKNSGVEGLFSYPWRKDTFAEIKKNIENFSKGKTIQSMFAQRYRNDNLIVHSAKMKACFRIANRCAQAQSTVLIYGESGTGKEILSRYIHDNSARALKPFVAVNCNAFSAGLLESELFGHEKGAFTGAERTKKGVFEQANGGTLFLDEIGEISLNFQTKLLRVIQERKVRKVGSSQDTDCDFRLIVASNKNLQAEVALGTFREDLYYRLAVIPIKIPSLRERKDDILPLCEHFLKKLNNVSSNKVKGWDEGVEAFFLSYQWPGNVRELENFIERAHVMCDGKTILMKNLMDVNVSEFNVGGETLREKLEEATKKIISETLRKVEGRKMEAATTLGIDRTTLYRLMKKHDL